jgi:hypothetical protein
VVMVLGFVVRMRRVMLIDRSMTDPRKNRPRTKD